MKTRLLSGVLWICGETIVPERLAGFQLSFNFTERFIQNGVKLMKNQVLAMGIKMQETKGIELS